MASQKVLITGATGKTGSNAIARLLEMKVPVRAMVHSIDARSETLKASGVEVVVGDVSSFDDVYAALAGISAAYYVFPIQVGGIVESTAYFAQAAIEQSVQAIVNMSQISARRVAKSNAARDHWFAERIFDRSGVAVTHLRPTFFAEWITYMARAIRDQNVLPLPFGKARYAPISAEDQGRAIATILTAPAEHAGKTYPLYGPEELSQYNVAALLSKTLGRTITYAEMEIPAYSELLKSLGFNEHFQQHIASVAQDCRDGLFSGTNDNIEKLTGRKPMGMSEFIEKNKAIFMA